MPRNARMEFPETLYHVSNHGNDGVKVFLSDADYEHFLSLLRRAKEKHGLRVYHWALVPTGFRLLVETSERPCLAVALQGIQLGYTRYFHGRYRRSGHLWHGRFRSFVVEKERYQLLLGRHVEAEPERAGLHGRSARWTSRAAYLGDVDDQVTDVNGVFRALAHEPRERKQRYENLKPDFDDAGLRDVTILGSDAFRQLQVLKRQESIRPRRGRPPKKR